MYISYDDILESIARPPKWWLYGVPRFNEFRPEDVSVYGDEVALVRTECQACGQRYDVGVVGQLRARLAYSNSVEVGDPPNACDPDGCPGAHMQSEEIKLLQYWARGRESFEWIREKKWERRLSDYDGPKILCPPLPPIHRVSGPEWYEAQRQGDTETMSRLLKEVGCEFVDDVVTMLELERKMTDARRR